MLLLKAMAEFCDGDYNMYFPFKKLSEISGIPLVNIRRTVRSLARKGLAEYEKGLWSENTDGPAGAGYGCTQAGYYYINPLEEKD